MATMNTFTGTREVVFAIETCCVCGVEFGMTAEFNQRRRADHVNFYCPNGHHQHYPGKSPAQVERELRAALDAEMANVERLARERDGALDALSAAKREAKRLERRTSNGVCTHCNRTFVQLQRHMKSKHPDHVS